MTRNQARRDRPAAAIREQQRRAERRRMLLILGSVAAAVVALIVITVRYVSDAGDEGAVAGVLDEVVEFADLSRNHVTGAVEYPQRPPVGGDHSPVWVNCGAYTAPVPPEQAVHSLEHGAVWLAHDPALPAEEVEVLAELAESNGFVLVSPMQDLPSPVVATAWGRQLEIPEAGDERVEAFITSYAQGPQTPEPGAPCTGGVSPS